MKHVLVTGGAGFIGSHLVERLLAQGSHVTVLDNFSTGSRHNLAAVSQHAHLTLIEHDVIHPVFLDWADDDPRLAFNEIYNLACPASPVHYQHNPVRTVKTNVLGIINILGLAKRTGAKLLQASTSEVYGDPLEHPQQESYWGRVNPVGLRSCYDEGKRVAETLCMDYHRQHGLRIKLVRIFNTYGPRMAENDGRVVSNFVVQALKNQPLTLYGNGQQTRSFCYVDDLVTGLMRLMAETPDEWTGPVNLGNPAEFTVAELAQQVIRLTGSSSTLSYLPLPSDDPVQRQPDITLVQRLLPGWAPTVDLPTGLQQVIDYFEQALAP